MSSRILHNQVYRRFDVGSVALARDVLSPDDSGNLVIDVGPAVRLVLSEQALRSFGIQLVLA
jgi:hypothetical protein